MALTGVSSHNVDSKVNRLAINSIDKEIQMLQKQKESLNQQMEKVKESKMDVKQKMETVNELQKQIAEIDKIINQKEVEKMKPQEVAPTKQDEYISGQKSKDGSDLSGIVNLTNLCTDYRNMFSLRKNLNGQIGIAKKELALDEARSTTGNGLEYKRKIVSNLEERRKDLEKKIGEKTEEIQGEQKKQSKEVKNSDSTEENEKIKEDNLNLLA